MRIYNLTDQEWAEFSLFLISQGTVGLPYRKAMWEVGWTMDMANDLYEHLS